MQFHLSPQSFWIGSLLLLLLQASAKVTDDHSSSSSIDPSQQQPSDKRDRASQTLPVRMPPRTYSQQQNQPSPIDDKFLMRLHNTRSIPNSSSSSNLKECTRYRRKCGSSKKGIHGQAGTYARETPVDPGCLFSAPSLHPLSVADDERRRQRRRRCLVECPLSYKRTGPIEVWPARPHRTGTGLYLVSQ